MVKNGQEKDLMIVANFFIKLRMGKEYIKINLRIVMV